MDDFSSLAQKAIPLIVEHGPKMVSWLWDRFVKNRDYSGKQSKSEISNLGSVT